MEWFRRSSARFWDEGTGTVASEGSASSSTGTFDHEIVQLTKLRSEPSKHLSKMVRRGNNNMVSPVKMLAAREANYSRRSKFSMADGCHVLSRYLPVTGPYMVDQMGSCAYVSQFSGDGSLLVAGFQGSHIRVYNVEKGFKVQKDILAKSLRWTITDTSLSPDQRYLVYSSMSPVVHIVDVGSAVTESLANVTEIHEGLDFSLEDEDGDEGLFGIFSVKFSTDGRELVAASSDNSIYVYDVVSNKRTLKILAHEDDVNTVCFADESGNLIYSGSDDSFCKVWDRRCLNARGHPAGTLIGHLEGITFIDSRGDGRYFISNGKDQTIKLWDIRKMSSSNPCASARRNRDWDYRWMDYPARLREKKHPNDQSLTTYRGHSVLRTLIRCHFSPEYSKYQVDTKLQVSYIQAVTISTNAWTNAGHAVNQIYDLLFMMGRDDIAVGVGGEGGISKDGTIFPNVGGYLPIIEQGMTTTGYCRYRQAVPVGLGGRLDIDTNFGIRKAFLPQGSRRYLPLYQPPAQQVMIDVISKGPTTVFMIGTHTNFALFLMSNPHLKRNVEHIYIVGGGVRSKNPTGCCPKNASASCKPEQCGDHGNLFTDYTSNPYAEFNFFGDPFAAYQVIHSGIPVTLVPLDATNTIPITKEFFEAFERSQNTYEAQYCFKSLKIARDTWFNDDFYTSYFMWDSFMAGVAVSIMSKPHTLSGKNKFAEMEYRNITVVTSNKPYGISDGSNPFFDQRKVPKFQLKKGGVQSGHVQRSLRDPFCLVKNGKGRCQDGYTKEITGPGGVRVLVASKAKPNKDPNNLLDREFFLNFLDVLNRPQQSGRFNFTTQFPHYKDVLYKPDLRGKKLGHPIIFDMDMSPGDFIALFYLLKVPIEVLDLKAILVTPTGWANAATIDVVYDLLHMMGRDDIPVGLGDVFARNQSDPLFSAVGDCKYVKAIPHGSGGFLDSDTLYGLARNLPRSPRRYTAENSVKFGAPRDTDHPELRQPLALEIWEKVTKTIDKGTKIRILTNGPLTTLSKILSSDKDASSRIQDVFVMGGHINYGNPTQQGNLFTVPSNKYAEFNMFLDPLAAKIVIESELDVTLIPWGTQKMVSSFSAILERLSMTKKTPEVRFVEHLISKLQRLQKKHIKYQHMDIFLGEMLGAVILANGHSSLNTAMQVTPIKVLATGIEDKDGQIMIDEKEGTPIKVLDKVDDMAYYDIFATRLGDEKQSAKVGSFSEQVVG